MIETCLNENDLLKGINEALWNDFQKVIRIFCHECCIPRNECAYCWMDELKRKWKISTKS